MCLRSAERAGLALAVLLVPLGWGCRDRADVSPPATMPAADVIANVPLGDVAGPELRRLRAAAAIANPLHGDARARARGEQLFTAMNCVACHGYDARGGMGPDLTDDHWRYGGLPVQVYKSIHEGRPKGMPAFGRLLPAESIWQMVSHLETLGGVRSREEVLASPTGDRQTGAARTLKGRRHGADQ